MNLLDAHFSTCTDKHNLSSRRHHAGLFISSDSGTEKSNLL